MHNLDSVICYSKLCDGVFGRDLFDTILKGKIACKALGIDYHNNMHSYTLLQYQTPAPEVIIPISHCKLNSIGRLLYMLANLEQFYSDQ